MKREIIINGGRRETRVAILEDERLVELLHDRPEISRTVGNVYLGRVEAVLPGMQAAFIDIGAEKSAFLHAADLLEPDDEDDDDAANAANAANGGNEAGGKDAGGSRGRGGRGRGGRPPRGRNGPSQRKIPNIQDHVQRGQNILVQVTKEPISTKGSRVTRQISFAGRFLVFMPYASKIGVSRKIDSRDERTRLRKLVRQYLPKDSGGVIVRTVAREMDDGQVKRELKTLLNTWNKVNRKGNFARLKAPVLVHREASLTSTLIRDAFSEKVDRLIVDSKQLYGEIRSYLGELDPDLLDRVKQYREAEPIFDKFGIEAEIQQLFRPRVDLPSGGYVIVEPTEALVSIDVNTGRYTGRKDAEKTILRTNLEAAREIARQIRLRDLGGIIVIDFIDMDSQGNRDKVLQELRTNLGRDRARTRAFQVSALGLIEMTRQRVRPALWDTMAAPCPACTGSGKVFKPAVVVRRLERSIRRVSHDDKEQSLTIRVHPEVALYLMEEEPKFLRHLQRTASLDIDLRDDPIIPMDEFRLVSQPAGRDVTERYAVA